MTARMTDDAELVREVVDEFLSDIPRQIEKLKGALAAGDHRAAERQAHSIKGAAANVAAEALRAVASAMEEAGKAGNMATVQAMVPQIESEFGRLREMILRERP